MKKHVCIVLLMLAAIAFDYLFDHRINTMGLASMAGFYGLFLINQKYPYQCK